MMNNTVSKNSQSVSNTGSVNVSVEIGKSLADNNTYEGRKKSVSDIITDMQATDISVAQDYMTVMSHTVSDEDYKRLVKDGVNPMDVSVEDSATILDNIKVAVAKGGTNVEGFTDTLDSETISEITGIKVSDIKSLAGEYDVIPDQDIAEEISASLEKAAEITEVTDGMKLYLMNTDAPLSIDSLYLAKHSAASLTKPQGSEYFGVEAKGYLVKKGDNAENIKEMVSDLLKSEGLPTDTETIENGVWLVNNSIPVSKETLDRISDINSINVPFTNKELAKISFSALSKGEKPADTSVINTDNVYARAVEGAKELEESGSLELLKKTRDFAEISLKMLTEANIMLLKSDYSIDTSDLKQYTEALKQISETKDYKVMSEFNDSVDKIETVKAAPVEVLGAVYKEIATVTVETLYHKSESIKAKYERAGESYEQLGTQVRRDLGDSIRKAFSNVDDILEDLGFDRTKDNQRAVRVLGYNSLPITRESINEIKEADRKVQNVLSRITPMDTLSLIRDGKSPIKMSIDELNEYLDSRENTEQKEIEKYSKFLFKLEKSGDITEGEREEFINVYRFFYQLEKGDLAAVGSVLNAGSELTIANLKTAIKTAKHTGMDVKVDESYGFLVEDIRNELEPEKIKAVASYENKTLEALYDELREADINPELEHEYIHEELTSMREAMKAPEEVVSELIMNRVTVTANTLSSMKGLMKQRGDAFSKVSDTDDELFGEISEEIENAMTDAESAKETYESSIAKAKEAIFEEALNQDSYIDVRSLQHIFMELSVAAELSKSETYEVPVEIGGEATSINLKIVHNSKEEANVVITFETEELGRISARLGKENGNINGYISCILPEALSKMKQVADKLGKDVYIVSSGKTDSDLSTSKIAMRNNDEQISTKELYETAKAFLEAVKGIN